MENQFRLAQRIRAFRKLKGYTQNELADLLDVSIAIVGAVERGTRKADPRLVNRIAEVLDIGMDELSVPVAIERSSSC